MTTTDRVTAVIDNATRAHNAALAAVITQARSLTDEEAEALAQRLQEIPEIVLTEARRVIDYAALDQSATTGEQGIIAQIGEAADAGWYAAGEASGEAAAAAKATGKWSPLGDADADQHWIGIWNGAWQAVSDAARARAAQGLLPAETVDERHYNALLAPWRAAFGHPEASERDGLLP